MGAKGKTALLLPLFREIEEGRGLAPEAPIPAAWTMVAARERGKERGR